MASREAQIVRRENNTLLPTLAPFTPRYLNTTITAMKDADNTLNTY